MICYYNVVIVHNKLLPHQQRNEVRQQCFKILQGQVSINQVIPLVPGQAGRGGNFSERKHISTQGHQPSL